MACIRKGLRILTLMTTRRREELEKIQAYRCNLLKDINVINNVHIDLDKDIALDHFSRPG